MCNDPRNCGRMSARTIARRTGFSKRSVRAKIRNHDGLPPSIHRDEGGSVGEYFCVEHLTYVQHRRREIFLYSVRRKQRHYMQMASRRKDFHNKN